MGDPVSAVRASNDSGTPAVGSWTEGLIMRGGLLALGAWYKLGVGLAASVTLGDVVAMLTIPLWLSVLHRYQGARLLLGLGVLAAVSGLALADAARPDHIVSLGISALAVMLLVGVIFGACFVVWARERLTFAQIGIWYGLGLIAGCASQHSLTLTTAGWKGGLAVAAGVFGLAVAGRARWRGTAEIAVLVMLAGLSSTLDSRSYFATFLLTLMVIIWQLRPRVLSRRGSWIWTAVFMGGLSIGIYQLGSALLVNGYLGRAAQARSIQQIDTAGSLILGGRPELGASGALFMHRPTGFGAGVIANAHDVAVAKAGLVKLNYEPNNGYVDRFMFGGQIELHSTMGDLWANFGIAGLAVCTFIAFLVVRGLAQSVVVRSGGALLVFLCWYTIWNLLFSPFLSAAPSMLLVLGLVLTARTGAHRSALLGATRRHRPGLTAT